jgi:hypothetical protein
MDMEIEIVREILEHSENVYKKIIEIYSCFTTTNLEKNKEPIWTL